MLVALAPTTPNGSLSPLAILFPARCMEILPRGVFCCIIRNADTVFLLAPWLIFSYSVNINRDWRLSLHKLWIFAGFLLAREFFLGGGKGAHEWGLEAVFTESWISAGKTPGFSAGSHQGFWAEGCGHTALMEPRVPLGVWGRAPCSPQEPHGSCRNSAAHPSHPAPLGNKCTNKKTALVPIGLQASFNPINF